MAEEAFVQVTTTFRVLDEEKLRERTRTRYRELTGEEMPDDASLGLLALEALTPTPSEGPVYDDFGLELVGDTHETWTAERRRSK